MMRAAAGGQILLMLVASATAATVYDVGAPGGGWDMSTDLKSWASSQKFAVGDSLRFTYAPFHNVAEVTKTDYDACSAANPLGLYSGGSTTVLLAGAPGRRYFICGVPGHCQAGMKLTVDVAGRAASPVAPHPPPVPVSPPTPSPPPPLPVLPPSPPVPVHPRPPPVPVHPRPPPAPPVHPPAPAPAKRPGHKKRPHRHHHAVPPPPSGDL